MENKNIVDILKDVYLEEEAFVEDEDYPDIEQALITLLDEHSINLSESDIEVLSEKMGIDSDGYPFLAKDIFISKYGCRVEISAYHHKKWDFFIEDVELISK